MLKTIGTLRKINAILQNIKINQPKSVIMYRYKFATNRQKFHGNMLSLSENTAKRFRGGY